MMIPKNIVIEETNNYRPKYSFIFLISVYIYFTFLILLPNILIYYKISRRISDTQLKKKYNYFFIGSVVSVISLYGAVLYNTWQHDIYRVIWSFASFLLLPAMLLIYYGVARDI
ncbi:MAG: hypothetical protein GF353_09085 [Candidatus Lokiarchaeota archaeon]|nr:hypothetical protein [Candidatus Lokiarchaeota archaeon]